MNLTLSPEFWYNLLLNSYSLFFWTPPMRLNMINFRTNAIEEVWAFFLTFIADCLGNMNFFQVILPFLIYKIIGCRAAWYLREQGGKVRPQEDQWLRTIIPVTCRASDSAHLLSQCSLRCITGRKNELCYQREAEFPSCQQRHSTPSTYCTLLRELIA